jgi:hypothetical protein
LHRWLQAKNPAKLLKINPGGNPDNNPLRAALREETLSFKR